MFRKIDDWLIDGVLQKKVDTAREKYGVTSYWIAATLGYVFVGVYLAEKFFNGESGSHLTYIVLTLLGWGLFILLLERHDRRAKETVVRTMSPFREPPFLLALRMMMCVFLVIDAVVLLLVLFSGGSEELTLKDMLYVVTKDVLMWCVYYVSACSTKPQSPHKAVMPVGAVGETS